MRFHAYHCCKPNGEKYCKSFDACVLKKPNAFLTFTFGIARIEITGITHLVHFPL